jgi:hypothetical protein
MARVFEALRAAGCRFVVAGRLDAASGAFLGLADAHVPAELADLFTELPDFREDVSSTQLRAAAAAGGAAAAAAGR